jgi:outer membrane protein OmpA-like peptidoglycan-associated protein
MKRAQVIATFALIGSALVAVSSVHAADAVDVGAKVPDAKSVKEGLFPEDSCKELEASGFKCMGFKPAIRYSLPASSFQVGSAELPATLKKQLDVFADVLKSKRGSGQQVKIEGHADASGTPEGNQALSMRRAEAVKAYLVAHGADAAMLVVAGAGAKELKDPSHPFSGENRRVEIGREQPPQAAAQPASK